MPLATVEDIEAAVARLSKTDFERFFEWIEEYAQQQWDCEIENDSKAGKLDQLAADALRDFREGKCRSL